MSNLTADSYMQMLDRLDVRERIKCLEDLLKCPLEPNVRPVLRRAYLDLTDRAVLPETTAQLPEEYAR
jgi:hypothetical protein